MENKKVFLDTNIVADIIDSTRDNHLLSLKLLEYLVLEDYIISISEDMITALYYILKGKKTTLGFLEDVVFIDWTVLIFGKSVLEGAVKLSLEKDLDLEDTLQCLCAKENRCEMLITNDNKFYDCGIAIYSTKEFIEKNV
ncbi:MAG: PIN domain-containing protein [Sulfurimonas sp.]|nr:PIN domain-containing protein [Sulfurimonas sp.]